MYKTRTELVNEAHIFDHAPRKKEIISKVCDDHKIDFVEVDPYKPSILRCSDFDVQYLLDTNPDLLKPVGKAPVNFLLESDKVEASLANLSELRQVDIEQSHQESLERLERDLEEYSNNLNNV